MVGEAGESSAFSVATAVESAIFDGVVSWPVKVLAQGVIACTELAADTRRSQRRSRLLSMTSCSTTSIFALSVSSLPQFATSDTDAAWLPRRDIKPRLSIARCSTLLRRAEFELVLARRDGLIGLQLEALFIRIRDARNCPDGSASPDTAPRKLLRNVGI